MSIKTVSLDEEDYNLIVGILAQLSYKGKVKIDFETQIYTSEALKKNCH